MQKTIQRGVILALSMILLAAVLGSYDQAIRLGAGCTDWPGCLGQMIIPDARGSASPPSHGLLIAVGTLSIGVGLLAFLISLLAIFKFRQPLNGALILLALLVMAFLQWGPLLTGTVWVQGPLKVILHSGLMALVFLGLHRFAQRTTASAPPEVPSHGLLILSRLMLSLVVINVGLGGWVSSAGAGLACPDVPTCLGAWWQPIPLRVLWESLLGMGSGPLDAPALVALHFLHRLLGLMIFVGGTALGLSITSNPKVPGLSRTGLGLNFLLLLLVAGSLGVVLLRLPALAVGFHTATAWLLLWQLARISAGLSRGVAEGLTVPLKASDAKDAGVPLDAALQPPPSMMPGISGDRRLARLEGQLGKTRSGMAAFWSSLGQKRMDPDLLEELEAQLLMADMGIKTTQAVIAQLSQGLERQALGDADRIRGTLKGQLKDILERVEAPLHVPEGIRPFVILVVGVNGVGKTTTIGKLAKRLQQRGLSVMLAAGDTFRAAAVEQLQTWGERNEVPVIAQATGADSASVIFDALEAAKARGIDVLIADTAGRLHNKSNLMEELSKIRRIMARLDASAPHEVLLVLDGGTGQNALNQARQFNEAVGLTGIALTKLDGTAKGGVIFALADQFGIPIRFIGIGEGIDDLQDFNAEAFIEALFPEEGSLH